VVDIVIEICHAYSTVPFCCQCENEVWETNSEYQLIEFELKYIF